MGGLARLAAAAIGETHDPHAVHTLLDNLQRFSTIMLAQWRTGRLSEIPMSEESNLLHADTLTGTIPIVWHILKTVLFTTTMILQALTSQVIQNPLLCDAASTSPLP